MDLVLVHQEAIFSPQTTIHRWGAIVGASTQPILVVLSIITITLCLGTGITLTQGLPTETELAMLLVLIGALNI